MSLVLDNDQHLLADTLRKMLGEAHPAGSVIAAAEHPHDVDDAPLWERLVQVGCPGLGVPVSLGGSGGGSLELVIAIEAAGYALLSGGLLATAGFAMPVLVATGDSPCAVGLVAAAASGAQRLSVAMDAEITTSSKTGDIVLDGVLPLVLEGEVADVVLLVQRDLVLAIPTSARGVAVRPAPTMDATRRFHDLHLDRVRVEPADVLARGTEAERALMVLRERGAIAVAADAIGSAQRALDDAVAYAEVREQFGSRIGSFQAVKHLLVDTHVAVDAARSAVWYAASTLDADVEDRELAIHVAKALAMDASIMAGANAVQVHGGIGFTRDVTCHLHVKRARLNERLVGSAAEHRRAIAAVLRNSGLPAGW